MIDASIGPEPSFHNRTRREKINPPPLSKSSVLLLGTVTSYLQWVFPPAEGDEERAGNPDPDVDEAVAAPGGNVELDPSVEVESLQTVT